MLGSWQAGLGLPDRDYYLQKDARMAQIVPRTRDYLALLLTQAGDTQAQAHAEQVLTLETAIARSHWEAAATHDPNKTTAPPPWPQLSKLAPAWTGPPTSSHGRERARHVQHRAAQPGQGLWRTDAQDRPQVWRLTSKTALDAHADLLSKPARRVLPAAARWCWASRTHAALAEVHRRHGRRAGQESGPALCAAALPPEHRPR